MCGKVLKLLKGSVKRELKSAHAGALCVGVRARGVELSQSIKTIIIVFNIIHTRITVLLICLQFKPDLCFLAEVNNCLSTLGDRRSLWEDLDRKQLPPISHIR